jgi:hypothetical protein
MENSSFNIWNAVKNACLFVGREWLYLAKIGALPVVVQIVISLFLRFQRPDVSDIEGWLWSFPATALFAWAMFIEIRLLLMGERLDRLPQDLHYLRDRHYAMKVSVLTALLFNMAMTAATVLLGMIAQSVTVEAAATQKTPTGFFAALFLMGGIFWSLRFAVVPILTAVQAPVRPFLKRVQGVVFPLFLAGMALFIVLPMFFTYGMMIGLVLTTDVKSALPTVLSDRDQIVLIVTSVPLFFLIFTLLNAGAAFALMEMAGKGKQR